MSEENIREIFTLLRQIQCDIASIRTLCPHHEKQIDEISVRLSTCEAVINRATGMYTIIGFIAGIIGSFVVGIAIHFLTRK
jgi:hypothetical protein